MPTAGRSSFPDVVIVGSGPNGLTAGVGLARAGLAVLVLEAADTPGGGCRSAALTLPGYVHDRCSAVHPMAALSPVFRDIGLERFGLEWVRSPLPLAHPLPDGNAVVLPRALADAVRSLGGDGDAWRRLLQPFADEAFIRSLLQPVWSPHGGALLRRARFGFVGLQSSEAVARHRFHTDAARALFSGCAAHANTALDRAGTASFGVMLAAAAHVVGWPCARGGSQAITAALMRALESHGGVLETGRRISDLRELPDTRAVLFDLNPRQVARIAGDALPGGYRSRLERFPHGAGVFKVDWALREPIPWRHAECRDAMTVHAGGAFSEILRSESEVAAGRAPDHPFVLVAQPSRFDPTRAPAGRHTGWAYCHVPSGCPEDMTERIEAQIERFAPGFRDCILARHRSGPAELEAHNSTMIGGDIGGGANDLAHFLFRPVARWNPYRTPNPRLFICSSSTPPGGGVHGMCGYHAAQAVLHTLGVR